MSESALSPTSFLTSILSLLLNSELIRTIFTEVIGLWRESRFHGTYRVEHHQSTLELLDSHGKTAIYTKRQQVVFLQDDVFAIQDQAWGDGNIFAGYKCSPGAMVDRYKEGYRWKVLISLRAMRNKGDRENFFIERTITDGFTTPTLNFQMHVDHPTKTLTLSVILPSSRQPKRIGLIEQNMKRSHTLGAEHRTELSGGRVQYSWEVAKPLLYESYILRWEW
ncbi:MAG: hypothetical protein GC179_18595 [Anaerolineaceae bacterium]|nr:hypothetical protein [Anaerolineaceae bacterium]